jgi:hypothetical protein
MFELHEFYEELATKYNLSYDQIERISRSEFRWLMENIQSGEFKIIKLKKIGKFVPNKVGIGFSDIYYANKLKCSDRDKDQGEGEVKEQDSINQENV